MSNEEKKLRELHQAFRKRWLYIISGIIAVLTICTVISTVLHYQNKKDIYIQYNEASEVDYKVYLKENDFYDEEYLGKGQSYIATLVDHIVAEFNYKICMQQENVNFKYSYGISSQLEVFDNTYKKVIYNPTDVLVEEKVYYYTNSDCLTIKDDIAIDYNSYNEKATKFVEAYELTSVDCTLIVSMNINVTGACNEFEADTTKNYTMSLAIPLIAKTTDITLESSVPTDENKLLSCTNAAANSVGFKVAAIISGSLDVLAVAALIVFMDLTRDKHIDYASKVARILRNYKSYIQQINNDLDDSEYQVLLVNTFTEMLDIRDTLQRPVLFHENDDKTCANFYILTDTMVMYLFKIEVQFDEIEELEEVIEEQVQEEVVEEQVQEEEIEEQVQEEVVEEQIQEEEIEEQVQEEVVECREQVEELSENVEPQEENVEEINEDIESDSNNKPRRRRNGRIYFKDRRFIIFKKKKN